MTSQYITELSPYCNPQLWTFICPLIFYVRVEMNHLERVFRQFEMIQNIPPFPQDRDIDLHRFDRMEYIGFDWEAHHIQYISSWIKKFETIVRKALIRDTVTRDDVYSEWYDRVTHRFISPANRIQTTCYQVGDAYLMQFLVDQLTSLSISAWMRPLKDLTAANSLLERYISIGEQATTLLISRDLPLQMPLEQPQPSDNTQTTINRRRGSRTKRSSSSVKGDTISRTQIPPFTGHALISYHCPPAFNISPILFPPMTSMHRDHIHDTSLSSYHNTYVDDNSQTNEISQYFDTVAHNRGERAREYKNRRPRGCGTGGYY
ncbi:hypothetical protein Pfo_014108 [Paulownia fortunei]|nr:hypothetical protein Pfo_014108 [Paulownia fortunei]